MDLSPALHVARAVHTVLPFAQLRTANLFAKLNGSRPATVRRRIFGHQIELRAERSTTHVRVYLEGEAAVPDAAVLGPHLRRGMVVFDVGANIGYLSLFFSQRVGSSGKVYSFEPEASNFAELFRNVEINGLQGQCVPIPVAVGRSSGKVAISNGLNGGVVAEGEGSTCQLVSLDSYAAEHGIPRIDLVKIDIEGYELEALEGMTEILSRPHKPILYVEVHPTWMKGDPVRVCEFLQSRVATILGVNGGRSTHNRRLFLTRGRGGPH
jgi:FkbM family methyltransferase